MKTFVTKVLIFFVGLTIVVFSAYFILDPKNTTIGDVRYIKTQGITSDETKYDALLIGSSRVYDIGNISDCGFNTYNYGFIQALPKDFPAFITYARQQQPIKKIVLGLDFYGSSTKGLNDARSAWKPSQKYVEEVESDNVFKRTRTMYDFGRFKRLVNYKVLGNDPFERSTAPQAAPNKEWKPAFWSIYEGAYTNYVYDDSLAATYQKIKEAAGDAELVVYITPESEPLFKMLTEKNRTKDYERFIRTATQVFGKVYNLMEVNQFTQSPAGFKDESHLTNDTLHRIVCSLLNTGETIPGTVLTQDNIDQYIAGQQYIRK
jgi:hypothetical protein